MLSFVSDPGFSALLLFLILLSEIIFDKELVDCVVRNMFSVLVLDYLLKTSCTTILLFVDFQD